MSSLKCENICNFQRELIDEIDESNYFTRNEECPHYKITMHRILNNGKIKVKIKINCKKCNSKSVEAEFESLENKYEFKCCQQKRFIFSFNISLNKPKKEENELNNNSINNDINNNYNNNILYDNISIQNDEKKDNDEKDLISDKNSIKSEVEKNNFNKRIDLYTQDHIAEQNKIIIKLKYLKKTNVNYFIHCSKESNLRDILKFLQKENKDIKDIKFAVCEGQFLAKEKTIKSLKLKDKSLVLIK